MRENETRLTLHNENGKYSVSVFMAGLNMENLRQLMEQLALAAGYPPDLVKEYLGEQ